MSDNRPLVTIDGKQWVAPADDEQAKEFIAKLSNDDLAAWLEESHWGTSHAARHARLEAARRLRLVKNVGPQ